MKPITQTLQQVISTAVMTAFDIEIAPETIRLEHPAEENKGDYATNIAMVLAGKLKRKPMEIAQRLAEILKEGVEKAEGIEGLEKMVESVESAAPGFLNFRLKPEFLIEQAVEVLDDKGKGTYQSAHPFRGKKIMVEFAHPNPLKEFHIGHLRNIALGESLVRLLEATGAIVFRANYEADIGMHTAKALWGVKKKIQEEKLSLDELRRRSPAEKAEFLGQAYALGSKAAEDEKIKKEITELNKEIYKNPHAAELWEETRQWSLDYFDSIYKRLGSRFDRLFFESEMEKPGRQLVIDAVGKGIFIKDPDGSIYFPGEKLSLNNCVFVTRENYATYEGKDMALEHQEYQTFPYDLNVHIVANEQINFFQIVFAALEQLFPYQKGRQYHFAYGMVKLKSGKMSSRTGEVITADELIDMAKEKVRKIMKQSSVMLSEAKHPEGDTGILRDPSPASPRVQDDMGEEVVEKIAVAAVKYTMLRVNPKQDIAFDLASSVSLEGDSGPYLLYTYARCKSVMRKAPRHSEAAAEESRGTSGIRSGSFDSLRSLRMTSLNEEELSLLRTFYRFPGVVGEAAKQMSPNLLCSYLFDLAQRFNLFYTKHPILKQSAVSSKQHGVNSSNTADRLPQTEFRLLLTEAAAAILQQGLNLLGIETVERM